MNILHVETGRHAYGGPAQVELLMADLCRRGERNILLCCRGAAIAANQDAAVVLDKPIAGDLDVRLAFWVWQAVRRYGIDVVHIHSRRGADVWGGIGARLAATPAIVTRRVDNPEWATLARWKYALYDRVVVISSAVEAEIHRVGIGSARSLRIPDAVDATTFRARSHNDTVRAELGVPPGALCIGMVAQFIERKGHRELIAALSTVVQSRPDVCVVLCGQGPLRPAIERAVDEAGLASWVSFAGFREDMSCVMPAFDMLVHPARREGLGVVLLQAGACGVPVVAARAGGIVDVVLDGETGLLVMPGDSAALAEAITTLGNDRVRRVRMGEKARARVAEVFEPQQVGERYVALYRQLTSGTA
ncbi:glycosyltransferase [Salinisphaera sp. USBA-960]|uniref:glycosyltransferase n=1 Tax=Salinisphaera orenii TaxID=856731 RepID=UPI000DBE08C2|nr:glycosyltransferase [Salifodinibacter halophilus]NNC25450.1 glycosyltransferase [Salifodinibacter halophilus]